MSADRNVASARSEATLSGSVDYLRAVAKDMAKDIPDFPHETTAEWQIAAFIEEERRIRDALQASYEEVCKRLSDTPTWIACAEQLPKRRYVEEPGFPGISINCLVVDADGDFDVAAYDLEDANWYSLQRATFLSGITHWMPLPEAP